MIFVGDIASPNKVLTSQLKDALDQHKEIFNGKQIICNFEGMISDREVINLSHPILTNHSDVPMVLNRGVAPVICLANNHILDLPEGYEETIKILRNSKALFCGAGKTSQMASDPLVFQEEGRKVILYNACWDFLLYNHTNPRKGIYVSEIKEKSLISDITRIRQCEPNSIIVTYFHWSLDLEILPFPMYRRFSMDLIDSGVNLVVGSHSHCIQGGEKYKDGFIVYGLGNFFVPNNVFANGRIRYPEFAKKQLAFEFDVIQKKTFCHFFEYKEIDHTHILKHINSDSFEDSTLLRSYSPYRNLTSNEYISYFRAKRRKRFLIPVYTDYKYRLKNMVYSILLKGRARISNRLARVNIINWQK